MPRLAPKEVVWFQKMTVSNGPIDDIGVQKLDGGYWRQN